MQIITPAVITDAMLVSCSIAETDYAEWSPPTNYAAGMRCIYVADHSVYQRLVAGVSATAPNLDVANWKRVGPTNRWAMFDRATGTLSTAATAITFTIAPGQVRALALLDLNANSVTVVMTNGATEVYNRTVSLNTGYGVYDWYSYFFSDVVLKRTLVLTDLPPYSGGQITVTVNGGGSTQVGTVVVGSLFDLGVTGYGMQLGIQDYSKKETDDFGATTVVERAYAKRMSLPVTVRNVDVDEVCRRLQLLRATPAVWIGAAKFDQSVVYGFYKDWSVDIQYHQISNATLTIEGLT